MTSPTNTNYNNVPSYINSSPIEIKTLFEKKASLSEFQKYVTFEQIHGELIDGYTVLGIACKDNRADIVGWLLDLGANIDCENGEYKRTPLHIAAALDHTDVLNLLIEKASYAKCDSEGFTALGMAAVHGNISSLRILLLSGANIDCENGKYKQTPLHLAACHNHAEILKLLIASKASLTKYDSNGYSALGLSVLRKDINSVQILLDAGVDIDEKQSSASMTPLALFVVSYIVSPQIFADLSNSITSPLEMVRYLLSKGANVEAYIYSRTTLLAHTIGFMPSEFIPPLLDHGASLENTYINEIPVLLFLLQKCGEERSSTSQKKIKVLELLEAHLIQQLTTCANEFQDKDSRFLKDPLPLLQVLANCSTFISAINPKKLPPSNNYLSILSDLYRRFAKQLCQPIQQILFSEYFKNGLKHFIEEGYSILNENKESSLSQLHFRIQKLNRLLQTCKKLYSTMFSSPFSLGFEKPLTEILQAGSKLADNIGQHISLLRQKNHEQREKDFDEEDAYILLVGFGVGIADEALRITPRESYINLIGCEAEDLYEVGIQSGKDLRALGIETSLQRRCNEFKDQAEPETRKLLWKQVAESAQTMASFLKEFSLGSLEKENLSKLPDFLVQKTNEIPSKENEVQVLKELIESQQKYAQGLIRLYVSQGVKNLKDVLLKNQAESLADLRQRYSQNELFSLVSISGKKQKTSDQ